MEMTEMYDNALLGILQHVGNIQDFLHIYFGFLYRKTDFYRLLSSPSDKMGFPPGVAESMVLKVSGKHTVTAVTAVTAALWLDTAATSAVVFAFNLRGWQREGNLKTVGYRHITTLRD